VSAAPLIAAMLAQLVAAPDHCRTAPRQALAWVVVDLNQASLGIFLPIGLGRRADPKNAVIFVILAARKLSVGQWNKVLR
jgi:hypothetical protein